MKQAVWNNGTHSGMHLKGLDNKQNHFCLMISVDILCPFKPAINNRTEFKYMPMYFA